MSDNTLAVAVIGCGAIGSRHLQALGSLKRPATVYAVDPSPSARANAARLFIESKGGADTSLKELESISALPARIDITIVATTAAGRRNLVASLLAQSAVKHVILEKFLFQAVADYADVSSLLTGRGVKAWVNCPRRLWPSYYKLRAAIGSGAGPVALSCATHARYGIGTSAIHMLDALAFLCGRADFRLHGDAIDHEIIQNPRGGIEMTGSLYGASKAGDLFRYTSYREGELPSLVSVETAHLRAIIDEGAGKIRMATAAEGWVWQESEFKTMFQSQLTDKVVADLANTGKCLLPAYDESSKLHLACLEPMLAHYRRHVDSKAAACPIT